MGAKSVGPEGPPTNAKARAATTRCRGLLWEGLQARCFSASDHAPARAKK
ncbi:DUF6053 domain-containing protein [Lysobacter enzymogenes]